MYDNKTIKKNAYVNIQSLLLLTCTLESRMTFQTFSFFIDASFWRLLKPPDTCTTSSFPAKQNASFTMHTWTISHSLFTLIYIHIDSISFKNLTLNFQTCLLHVISIILKEETDFIEPQLLRNHTRSEIFVIWLIGILYCTY